MRSESSILLSAFCAIVLSSACTPDDGDTSGATDTSVTSLDPSAVTTSSVPTSTSDMSTTGTPSTSEPVGGPCDGVPNDDECMCVGADADFCADLDAFCYEVVLLDLSNQDPPGTDYCDTIGSWCASPGVSTHSACELLESTCKQVTPSGKAKDCNGLRDACACDGFVINAPDTTGGVDMTTGDTTTGEVADGACEADEDCALGEVCDKYEHACQSASDTPCIWTHIPAAGQAWGPCISGDKCTEEGTDCRSDGLTSVCLPSCGGGECPVDLCGGVCRDDGGACVPACEVNNDCPFPGMLCNLSAGPLLFCGWPA